jgi:tRNA threonylcarbamoyladenosine biosynthesis protein TsaE
MMQEFRLEADSPADLGPLLSHLQEAAQRCHILTFSGEPGAGKTTLIAQLCQRLGVYQAVNSPTFSLINEYRTTGSELIVHADWYRVKVAEELFDAGMLEYLDSGDLCLIEWPMVVPEIWERYPHVAVEIAHLPETGGRAYRVVG